MNKVSQIANSLEKIDVKHKYILTTEEEVFYKKLKMLGCEIVAKKGRFSIISPEHNIIVSTEPTLSLALRHGLARLRFMGLIARAVKIIK